MKATEAKCLDHLLSWHNIVVEDQRRRVLALVMRGDVVEPVVEVHEESSKSGCNNETNKTKELPKLTANIATQLSRQNQEMKLGVSVNDGEEPVAEIRKDTLLTSGPESENQISLLTSDSGDRLVMVGGKENMDEVSVEQSDEVRVGEKKHDEVNVGEVVNMGNVGEGGEHEVGRVSTHVIQNTDIKQVTPPHVTDFTSGQDGAQLMSDLELLDPMCTFGPHESDVSNVSPSLSSRREKPKLVVSNKLFGKRKRFPGTSHVGPNMFADSRLDNVWHTCEECGEVVARGKFYSSHIKHHSMNKASYVAKYPHKKVERADWTCRICSKRLVWTSRSILPHLAIVHRMTKNDYLQLFLVSEEKVGPPGE